LLCEAREPLNWRAEAIRRIRKIRRIRFRSGFCDRFPEPKGSYSPFREKAKSVKPERETDLTNRYGSNGSLLGTSTLQHPTTK